MIWDTGCGPFDSAQDEIRGTRCEIRDTGCTTVHYSPFTIHFLGCVLHVKSKKMAYNQKLAGRIREELTQLTRFEEKEMMGGLTFMVDDKMCVGVMKDEMMCRIDPAMQDEVLKKTGCRRMEFTGRPMKGFLLVNETGIRTKKDLAYWIQLCLDFNPKAKSSKKRK